MSNDFASLLASFQNATGSNNSRQNNSKKRNQQEKSLLQLTSDLWRVSQIKQSTRGPTTAKTEKKKALHISVCVCVVDDLPHEEIWKEWLAGSNERISASVHVHAKLPERINSPWVR